MTSFYLQIAGIVASLVILFLLSLVEGALISASPVTLRMILEREDKKAPPLLTAVIENQAPIFQALHFGIQFSILSAAILIAHVCFDRLSHWGGLWAFVLALGGSILLRQFLPRLATQTGAERKLVALLRALGPLIVACRLLAVPVTGLLNVFKRMHHDAEPASAPDEAETTDEEIQAYLEIGENEGILEKEDTRLIQSVVEFGDTLVREVMTPRTRIAACRTEASMGELRDIMVQSRHSRIPIFRDDMDHIMGIAYIRQLLAEYAQGREAEPIARLVLPALFVPETKRVSALLKELQMRGDHMAIVIDEFGGVAGLVTIEDLVEEIVGEIRDEDQAKVSEIIEESPGSFLFRGSTELYQLEELTGKKFDEHGASTVAGVIVSHLGRIPAPGEEFDLAGIRIHILEADRKRIRRLRVQLPGKDAAP
jgi:CBS domain containing-hemolysin-like protein